MKKPFLCRLGIHRWYIDGALFTSVRRCNYCPAVENERDAKKLERERAFWAEREKNGD